MLKLRGMMWMIVCLSHMLHKGIQNVQMAHKKKRRRNEDSEEHGESLQEVTTLTTLIVGEIKESSTRLSQAMAQEIKDKQAGLNSELNKINGLIMAQ